MVFLLHMDEFGMVIRDFYDFLEFEEGIEAVLGGSDRGANREATGRGGLILSPPFALENSSFWGI